MQMPVEHIMTGVSILIFSSILLSKVVSKLAVPALLVFLAIGMIAGSEGVGKIYFDDAYIAQLIGVIALAFIIFAGGFHTEWNKIRPILWKGIALSTVGVFITAITVGVFSYYLLDLSFQTCLLLGAIISSTDAAAVFSVLRSKNVNLKGTIAPLLEFESGSNDPMAVLLTVGMIKVILGADATKFTFIIFFIKQIAFGVVGGYLVGKLTVWVLQRIKLEYVGLYSVFVVSSVLITYGFIASIGGSGFLAVYVAGIMMSRAVFPYKAELKHFHDAIAWLMQIVMFVILGLLVFPSQLIGVIIPGLTIALFLMFVGRTMSVFTTLPFFRVPFSEEVLISWTGLRGAVPIVVATFPLMAEVPHAQFLFNIVFFIVLTSVLLQGTTITPLARFLKLNE